MEKQYVAKFEKVSVYQYIKDISNNEYVKFQTLYLSKKWLALQKKNLTLDEVYKKAQDKINRFAMSTIDTLKKPKRSTHGSAGYDFFAPFNIIIQPGRSVVIPTGIRCKFLDENFALKIYPRSGLGFKYEVMLANTVGIIDSDYYNSDNEGHIMIKLTNYHYNDRIFIDEGEAFAQGIFEMYGLTIDDDEDEKENRNGGFGSTSSK